ncbi:MAG: citramalate synthase [Chloroflexi bacterium RBG_13_51_52]|nr:MAG: citramalate synthase [Chloroflexi bacterium RBG_13_51_52]
MVKVELYDTTLRDGAQSEGISFSVVDKLHIAQRLDGLGIHYIEGGWPGSNPKDAEFFEKARGMKLKNTRIAVFGSTRRRGLKAEEDNNLTMLVKAGVKVATIVGKSSDLQVINVLKTTLEENLSMIADSVRYLKSKGMKVFLDAEHFFDGFKHNPDYSLKTLEVAAEVGVDCLVLCDTNGGALPDEVTRAVKKAAKTTGVPLGIHCHNDGGLAVANTLAAVAAGATQVQGTINGLGERCGNADLCTIIPALKLKMGIDCVSDEQLASLTEVSHYVSELANLIPDPFAPYIGTSAFSHKAGYHMDGITKWPDAYQHIDPAKVGNRQRTVVSDQSGKRNIISKAKELGIDLSNAEKEVKDLLERVKQLESRGFQYDNAEASFELLLHRAKPDYKPPFELVDFMVVVESRRRPSTRKAAEEMLSEAMVKVKVGGEIIHTAAEGDGPVNALDLAMRKALLQYYPGLKQVKLVDYKVRILEESTGTESQVRVLIESSDGVNGWRTVGGSTNIIEASWLALADGLEWWLVKNNKK